MVGVDSGPLPKMVGILISVSNASCGSFVWCDSS